MTSIANTNKVQEVATPAAFAAATGGAGLTCVFFSAEWHEPCKAMAEAFALLAGMHAASAAFVKAETEAVPNEAHALGVESVPTFVFLRGGKKVGGVVGADTGKLRAALDAQLAAAAAAADPHAADDLNPAGKSTGDDALDHKIHRLINSKRVMLFMKGNAHEPRCGFSRRAIELMTKSNLDYGTFDILGDNDVRQGIKVFSNWPTFPQLYVCGKLIGGLDIMKELDEDGELTETLSQTIPAATAEDAAALTAGAGAGAAAEPSPEEQLNKRIAGLIAGHKCMLFMKGEPGAERCGFSRRVVALLNEHGIEFGSFDILTDNDVRQGIKKYSDWPTFPQFYVDSKLIGGLDILVEMAEEAEESLAAELGL